MSGLEIKIGVCSTGAPLDLVSQLVRQAGTWNVVPAQWPDGKPLLHELATSAQAIVLHSGTGAGGRPCRELVDLLGARQPSVRLVVLGDDPVHDSAPSLWLPTLPSAAVLGRMLDPLITTPAKPTGSAMAWRRKSDMIIGDSATIRELVAALGHVAASHTPVLVTGESGVGKELVARAVHYCGPRANAPFVPLNCAAIPANLIEAELFGYQRGAFTGAITARDGAFEAAQGGTLFLDEIGEMPLSMQVKLLRVLQTSEIQKLGSAAAKKVDFRLVSATNRNLEAEVAQGRFREDLYYRVMVYPIHVPSLRERLEDLPRLVTHYLTEIATRDSRPTLRLTGSALQKLLSYRWPGNVRELVNLLERAALLARDFVIDADQIVFAHDNGSLPDDGNSLVRYRDAKARFEHDYYANIVRAASGNISLAAKLAGKTRKEVYEAIRRHGLDSEGADAPARRRRRRPIAQRDS